MTKPLIAPRFYCRTDNMWLDDWRYGEWRQYACRRSDGSVQCARVADAPIFLGAVGVVPYMGALVGGLLAQQGVPVYWGRVIPACMIGFLLILPMLLNLFTPWRLMVAVGPRQYEGKRVFWHEVKDSARPESTEKPS